MLNVSRHPARYLREDLDRIFGDFFGSREPDVAQKSCAPCAEPVVDLWEDGDRFVVDAELPGIEPGQVEVSLLGRKMTLKGEWKPTRDAVDAGPETEKQADRKVFRAERRCGTFERVFEFPTEVDAEKVEAQSSNGVLTIFVPKAEKAKPRTIQVKTV